MSREVLIAATYSIWLLASCTPAPSETPAAGIVGAEVELAALGQSAMAYMAQPTASPTVKANIRSAFDSAYNAVTAAQVAASAGQSPDMATVTAALAALQSLVNALPKQGA